MQTTTLMTDSIAHSDIRMMIVDDHQMFIDGLKSLLRKEEEINIVAEAVSGQAALEQLDSTDINFVITDINMPGMSGTELAKTIKQTRPEVKVLVLSMFNEMEIIQEILMTEAEGYILKNTGKQELLDAIRHIRDNGTYYSNEVVKLMMHSTRYERQRKENLDVLTERELEILTLICEELSTADIAEKLFISPRTVETHRKNIMHKSGCRTLVGLIKFAIANQLVKV